jgi:quaternary ammonium compound-resistance protein SugE
LWLGVACAFEVVFALATNATHGFTRLRPSVVAVVAAIGGVVTLSMSLRTLDVSVAYAIWTAVGAAGTAAGSALLFGDALSRRKTLSIVAIIAGVVGLRVIGSA